jgi:hypothetical protein
MGAISDPEAGLPRVRILADVHRTQRAGAVLTVYEKNSDALRSDYGLSAAKARELIRAGKAELVGSIPLRDGEVTP